MKILFNTLFAANAINWFEDDNVFIRNDFRQVRTKKRSCEIVTFYTGVLSMYGTEVFYSHRGDQILVV